MRRCCCARSDSDGVGGLRYPAPMLPRVIAAMLVVCAATLVGCGESVRIQGTADEVWTDTIQILKLQGVMPAVI